MLPAGHRLRGDSNFSRLMKRGRVFFSSGITVRFVQNGGVDSRFAFVVSAKASKKATQRNLLKRRMREIVRKELPGIKEGYDILISAKKQVLDLDFLQLQSEVMRALEKSRLLKNKP